MRIASITMTAYALVAVLAVPAFAADDVVEVEGRGEATIDGGDKSAAKTRAKDQALRNAVEKAAGTFVVSSSETKDFELVRDQVLSAASGYVQSFDVVEEKEDAGTMVVRVKAKVGKAKLDKDLTAKMLLIKSLGNPRMALLIAEQHIGQSAPQMWWGPQGGGQAGATITIDQRLAENALIDQWKPVGFTFVDMEALAGKIRAANVVSTNPSANEVREIANVSDADVIIVGTAVATLSGDLSKQLGMTNGIPMNSCTANISLRAFNSDSGEILATAEATDTKGHVNTATCEKLAVNGAAKKAGNSLQGKIMEEWRKRKMGGSRVRLTVKNIAGFKILSEFKTALAEVRGVRGVDQKAFRNGSADLDVNVEGGDAEGLAGDIETKLAKLKARVVGVTANTIDVELGK